jgi:hypothetical protein
MMDVLPQAHAGGGRRAALQTVGLMALGAAGPWVAMQAAA